MMEDIQKFTIYYPLTKVEEQSDGTLRIWARATQEIPDRQGEIFDYASSKSIFQQRADENLLDTEGAVAMPMKSMHQPLTTPGKWMTFDYDDADKAIDICGKVVDPVDVKKVQEKVYRGVSVGGHYKKRWRDPSGLTRFTGDPTEISLVDKPAVPTAKISMFKVADLQVVEEETDLQKDNPNHDPANGQFTSGDGGIHYPAGTTQEQIDKINQQRGELTNKVFETQDTLKTYPSLPDGRPDIGAGLQEQPPVPKEQVAQLVDKYYQLRINDRLSHADAARQTYGVLFRSTDIGFNPQGETNRILSQSKKSDDQPAWVDEFNKNVQLLAEIRKADQAEKDKNESKMKSIGDSVGISRREDSPLTAPKDYPDDPDEYGDPANFNFPVDEKRHVQAVGRFNGGTGSEQYSPSERHIVGRRVARLASRFGDKYQYDPKEGQINRKEEKSMSDYVALTKEEIAKLDMPGMVGQLKAIKDQAADQVGKDPTTAVEFLMSNLEALCNNGGDSSAVGGSTTLPAAMADTGSSVAVKAADAKATPASTASTPSTPTPTETESEKKAAAAKPTASSTETPASEETTPSSSTPTPTPAKKADVPTEDEIQKRINDGIKAGFESLVASMKKSAPINDNDASPVMGGLQAIANGGKKDYADLSEVERKVVEIFDSEDPFAMQKAMKLVMGDDTTSYGSQTAQRFINEALAKATTADFNRGGVIMAKNFQPKIYTEPETK